MGNMYRRRKKKFCVCKQARAWIFLPSNFLNRFHIFIFSRSVLFLLPSSSFFYEFIFLFDCHLGVQLKIVPIHKASVRALTFSLSYHYCLNIQRFLSSRVCQRVKGMGENCLIVVESKRKSLPSSCSHSIKHNHFPYEYANNLILWQKISSVKQFSEETSKGILFV